MLRQHCPRMTNPRGNWRSSDHLDEQIANSFGSKESSSLKSLRVPAPMPPEGCPEPHHAEVVACDLFATPNSLKSRVARKVLSPVSIYPCRNAKVEDAFHVRSHSKSMDVEFSCRAQFPKEPAAPLVAHFPRFRALALFDRRTLQRGEGLVIAGGRKPKQEPTFGPMQFLAECVASAAATRGTSQARRLLARHASTQGEG
jgi:hypothetical protein